VKGNAEKVKELNGRGSQSDSKIAGKKPSGALGTPRRKAI
jgi:hypothetical protein